MDAGSHASLEARDSSKNIKLIDNWEKTMYMTK
jgi:hypothetical protein